MEDTEFDYTEFGDPEYWLALPPKARACALVGFYLQTWCAMESRLNECIAVCLDLSDLQSLVVTKNINLQSKLGLLKAVVNFLYLEKSPESDSLNKLLNDISNAARTDRNIAAHDMFMAETNGDGVEFLVSRGRNKIAFPDISWGIEDTLSKCEVLLGYTQTLNAFCSELNQAPDDLCRAVFRHTTRDSDGPTLEALLSRPPQDTPHSDTDLSTSKKDE